MAEAGGQSNPLPRRGGFVQLRDLPCVPWPHKLLQGVHSPQLDQPPSTKGEKAINKGK